MFNIEAVKAVLRIVPLFRLNKELVPVWIEEVQMLSRIRNVGTPAGVSSRCPKPPSGQLFCCG
ncbi:amino acid permease-associated region [Edwardsiella piscicida]|nr:amino acid permease-associated region [Edwardsiella piscicida]